MPSSESGERPDAGPTRPNGYRLAMRVVLTTLIILLFLTGMLWFRVIVLAALIGVMLGVLPVPMIRWMHERLRLPRAAGTAVVGVGGVLLFGGLGYLVYRTVVPEVARLVEQGPAIAERLNQYKDAIVARVANLGVAMEPFDLGGFAQGGAQLLLKGLSLGVDGIAGAVVVLMIAVFVMTNFDGYARGARSAFPPRLRPRAGELTAGAVHVLRRWFVGQIGVVTVSGVLTAIAMLILGVDYWLLIAALTIVLDFIPFIGAVITGGIALILTAGTEPEKALWVLLAFLAIQQIESNLVLPLVLKGAIRLPEAHLLLFVVVMGSAFGILGVFVAPPVFAVLHYLYCEAYVPWVEGREAGH